MTDWARYAREVMRGGGVLDDDQLNEMCSYIEDLQSENRELADMAESYQSALHLIGKRGVAQAVVNANARAEGWRRRWCDLHMQSKSGPDYADPPKVKLLEWQGPGVWCGQPHWVAETSIGLYTVTDHSVHGNGVQWDAPDGNSDEIKHSTVEDAKAAAEADYEARVLAALEAK